MPAEGATEWTTGRSDSSGPGGRRCGPGWRRTGGAVPPGTELSTRSSTKSPSTARESPTHLTGRWPVSASVRAALPRLLGSLWGERPPLGSPWGVSAPRTRTTLKAPVRDVAAGQRSTSGRNRRSATPAGEVHDVRPEIVPLDDSRQRPTLPQGSHISSRNDFCKHLPRLSARLTSVITTDGRGPPTWPTEQGVDGTPSPVADIRHERRVVVQRDGRRRVPQPPRERPRISASTHTPGASHWPSSWQAHA